MEFKSENIYFITLMDNEQRKNNVENIIKNILPKSNIFEAINALKLNNEIINKLINKGYLSADYVKRAQNRIGAIGCTLSHLLLWRKLKKSKNKYIIIIEDDTELKIDFTNKMNEIFKEIPANTDYVTFFVHPYYKKKQDKIKNPNQKISKCVPMCGTVCYLLTLKGVKKIFKYLKNKNNIAESDTILNTMIRLNLLNAYCSNITVITTLGAIGKKDFDAEKTKFSSTIYMKN